MNTKNIPIILSVMLLFACTKTDINQVIIKGKITNPIGKAVNFSNQDTSYSTSTNEDGSFVISFDLDSATYLNFEHGRERTAMFVKPGDKIDLSIDTEKFDETIKYKGSEESSFLAKLYLLVEKNDFLGETLYISDKQEYTAILDDFKNDVSEEFKKITDSAFIEYQIKALNENITYFLEKKEEQNKYSESVRLYLWETKKIGQKFNFYTALDSLSSLDFNTMTKQYTNKLLSLLAKVNDTQFIKETKDKIKKTTDNWIQRKTAMDNMPKEGDPAIDFTYPNKEGVEFSLSDFKGTLVYVDVWATWCGPCRAEIPYLEKLEKEYHGNQRITFLSVSVDRDKNDWLEMIEEKQLGGIQLWANGWSQITESYAIFGIPRFMLFSADGNVISTDAPRPSSNEIRSLINDNIPSEISN